MVSIKSEHLSFLYEFVFFSRVAGARAFQCINSIESALMYCDSLSKYTKAL